MQNLYCEHDNKPARFIATGLTAGLGTGLALAAGCVGMALSTLPAQAQQGEKQDKDTPLFGEAPPPLEAPDALMTNIAGREGVSFNGKWDIVTDEHDIGRRSFLGGPYFRTADPVGDYELREYSFDSRRTLNVPGDWNSQDDTLFRYRGIVWYQRMADVQLQDGKRYFVHFDGANYDTQLYVNGKPMGQHVGGYTAFNFDITDAIKNGQNQITVRVDAQLNDSTIPTLKTSDFFKYGGITRDVKLVAVPQTFIRQYNLNLTDLGKGLVKGWVVLDGPDAAGRTVNLAIPEAGVKLSSKTDANGRAEFTFTKKLSYWSPDNPKLYDVTFSTDAESVRDRIGFRTIARKGKQILLNGKPVFLRGISMHDESWLKTGVAFDEKDARAQLGLIKEMNGNYVRLAHYPHNEHAVRIADELGLMVWSEIPIVSLIDWDNKDTLKVAVNQLRDNIQRDRNRASIVMWSIGNETMPQSEERLAFLRKLAETVREEDGHNRLIAAALVGDARHEFAEVIKHISAELLNDERLDDQGRARISATLAAMGVKDPASLHGGEVEVMLKDKLGEIVDVIGYNEYFGWYYSSFLKQYFPVEEGVVREYMLKLMKDIRFRNAFGKPIIISEFGAGAKQGFHSDKAVLWSEEYQAKVYRAQLDMLSKSDFVQGMSPWILKDFRSAMRNLNGIQDIYNRKGVVSDKGKKKQSFYILQKQYGDWSKAGK